MSFYSTSSTYLVHVRRQGRKRTPPEGAQSTFAVDLTRKEAKVPKDAIHITKNETHPTRIHKTGKMSGRFDGGETNHSAKCNPTMATIELGKMNR
eukprot:scaffold2620_cov217-Chaetoceros_neogracile.AAC.3